jgi:hypothetical protein
MMASGLFRFPVLLRTTSENYCHSLAAMMPWISFANVLGWRYRLLSSLRSTQFGSLHRVNLHYPNFSYSASAQIYKLMICLQ